MRPLAGSLVLHGRYLYGDASLLVALICLFMFSEKTPISRGSGPNQHPREKPAHVGWEWIRTRYKASVAFHISLLFLSKHLSG